MESHVAYSHNNDHIGNHQHTERGQQYYRRWSTNTGGKTDKSS